MRAAIVGVDLKG